MKNRVSLSAIVIKVGAKIVSSSFIFVGMPSTISNTFTLCGGSSSTTGGNTSLGTNNLTTFNPLRTSTSSAASPTASRLATPSVKSIVREMGYPAAPSLAVIASGRIAIGDAESLSNASVMIASQRTLEKASASVDEKA